MLVWITFAFFSLGACYRDPDAIDPKFNECVDNVTARWHNNVFIRYNITLVAMQVRDPDLEGTLVNPKLFDEMATDFDEVLVPIVRDIKQCVVRNRLECIKDAMRYAEMNTQRDAEYRSQQIVQAFRLKKPKYTKKLFDTFMVATESAVAKRVKAYAGHIRECHYSNNPLPVYPGITSFRESFFKSKLDNP